MGIDPVKERGLHRKLFGLDKRKNPVKVSCRNKEFFEMPERIPAHVTDRGKLPPELPAPAFKTDFLIFTEDNEIVIGNGRIPVVEKADPAGTDRAGPDLECVQELFKKGIRFDHPDFPIPQLRNKIL
jgi:hypothetical protein